MSSNSFHGKIPSSFGEMSYLTILELDDNKFSGEVPRELISNCTWLHDLRISNNNLCGQLFSSYCSLTNLWFLCIENNYFSGIVQFPLSYILQSLVISGNQFSGTLPVCFSNMIGLFVQTCLGLTLWERFHETCAT